MYYTEGQATSFEDLISQIITWTTDVSIHGNDAWEVMRNDAWPRGTILKANGLKDGDKHYIGLMPNDIKVGTTYRNWFMQAKNLATYFVWGEKGLNRIGISFGILSNGIRIGDYSYTFTETPDIFTHSAKVLHLGVFKQYSDGLEWAEQAGGIDFDDAPLMPLQYRVSPGSLNLRDFVPPVLPGVGYPTLSMDINGPIEQIFKYYLIKDRHSIVIVMNNGGYWDSAYAGFFEPYDNKEYAFPAVVIGGTSGFTSYGKDVRYSSGQITPTAVVAARVDYHIDNWSLIHGIMPFSTVAVDSDACPSQTMVCLPDGRWQTFANYYQKVSAVSEHVCNSSPAKHYFKREEPLGTNIKFFIRPTENSVIDFTHIYSKDENKIVYKLEPIEFVQGDDKRTGILGRLPYMYFPSKPVKNYGKVDINNQKYIVQPNVWEDRTWHIKGYAGVVYDVDPEKLLAEQRRIERLSNVTNLLIRLED